MHFFKKWHNKRIDKRNRLGHKIFGNVWDNPKEKAGLLLFFWFIFFLIVITIIKTNSPLKNENKVNEALNFMSLSEIIEKQKDQSYQYNIVVYIATENININYQGKIISGIET